MQGKAEGLGWVSKDIECSIRFGRKVDDVNTCCFCCLRTAPWHTIYRVSIFETCLAPHTYVRYIASLNE